MFVLRKNLQYVFGVIGFAGISVKMVWPARCLALLKWKKSNMHKHSGNQCSSFCKTSTVEANVTGSVRCVYSRTESKTIIMFLLPSAFWLFLKPRPKNIKLHPCWEMCTSGIFSSVYMGQSYIQSISFSIYFLVTLSKIIGSKIWIIVKCCSYISIYLRW